MMTLRSSLFLALLTTAILITGCQKATVQGPGGKSLTLLTPKTLTIGRGETRTLEVGIERRQTTAPVTVSLSLLPDGVTARQASKTVETDAATFVLQASRQAALVRNQAAAVTIEGPDGMRGTEHIRMTVTK
jgi:hypothetical protein